MSSVVVLGAARFIGRAVVRRLSQAGMAVTALTRQAGAVEGARRTIACELTAASGWTRHLDGTGALIHLAATPEASGAGYEAAAWIEAEAATARHIAEVAARREVRQLVLVS
jgi:nucleoside-diphosphate-sugar epimerase